MKKISLFLPAVLLFAALLTGCGNVKPAAPSTSLVQAPGTGDKVKLPDVMPADDAGDMEPMPAEYAKNLLSLTDTATGSGISYSIQDVQRTKEFGSRALENLNDLSLGGMDGNGNLLGDEAYLFLTIQFTSTTDQTVEILRN